MSHILDERVILMTMHKKHEQAATEGGGHYCNCGPPYTAYVKPSKLTHFLAQRYGGP